MSNFTNVTLKFDCSKGSNLTEQQIKDLFKGAPEGYNYYTPNTEDWYEAWFMVKDGIAIKTMCINDRLVTHCTYNLYHLLEDGAIKRPEPKEDIKKETNMIEFDLERALAGEKVITRDGQEVTQLVKFDVEDDCYQVYGVLGGGLYRWLCTGDSDECEGDNHLDLFMAPKKLSGYMSISRNSNGKLYSSAVYKHKSQIDIDRETVTIIDLSTIEEGEGL